MGTGESDAVAIRLPRRTPGHPCPQNFGRENLPPFGRVCIALWGLDKPGVALAQSIGCTERQANRYIAGKTPASYEALMAVLDELRPRRCK